MRRKQDSGQTAEIQQNSDTTYRLYDWNRTDDSGRGRELHLEQALDSIGEFRKLSQRPGYLTEMPYFTTKEYRLDKGERFTQPDSSRFAVFTVLCGSVLWDGKTARRGDKPTNMTKRAKNSAQC